MKIQPLADRLVVKVVEEAEAKTKAGPCFIHRGYHWCSSRDIDLYGRCRSCLIWGDLTGNFSKPYSRPIYVGDIFRCCFRCRLSHAVSTFVRQCFGISFWCLCCGLDLLCIQCRFKNIHHWDGFGRNGYFRGIYGDAYPVTIYQ